MNPRPSSIDLYAFVELYRKKIEEGIIKKVYQTGKNDFLFQIYGRDHKKFYLFLSPIMGFMIHDLERPESPSSLIMLLRKKVSEKRVVRFEQINFDRVLMIILHSGEQIIFEMFRSGNVIITEDGKITFASETREWKNRKIANGEPYLPPSSMNPLSLSEDDLKSILENSNASIVQTLASRMNIGGDLAEELLYRIGLDKSLLAKNLTARANEILAKFHEILGESLLDRAFFYAGANILSPIEFKHISEAPDKEFGEFNEGLVDFILYHYPQDRPVTEALRRTDSIEKSIKEFEAQEKINAELGHIVVSNLSAVDKIIKTVRSNQSNPDKSLYPKVGEFSYKSYDPARKEIVLSDGEREFRLDANVSAGQNSNILFSRSKEYRQKIIGANKILEQTIKSSKKKETEKKKKRNLEWFENYHWFYSSEGFLVIAGKDAKSNERIVKRHLKDKDIYVHAEVYGAPSTIVKVEGNTSPTDKTLTEAGIFAVSFSRAWPAGVASSSAYWVLPSQVSKTPESGEYISTGSWIVRGKRNYMPNLPLRLQISMYSIKGGDIPMIHPVFEIKSQEKTVTIVPGEMKRSEAAKEISMKLGVEKEEIEKLLPPGGSKIED